MEARKCQVCGERHWGFSCKPKPGEVVRVVKPSVTALAIQERVEAKAAKPVKPKFDRTTYQRDLMRKRRAKDKAK